MGADAHNLLAKWSAVYVYIGVEWGELAGSVWWQAGSDTCRAGSATEREVQSLPGRCRRQCDRPHVNGRRR